MPSLRPLIHDDRGSVIPLPMRINRAYRAFAILFIIAAASVALWNFYRCAAGPMISAQYLVGVTLIFLPLALLCIAVDGAVRSDRHAIIGGKKLAGICPVCNHDLQDVPFSPDGCAVCPDCGAAWRRHESPAITSPLFASDDDRGRPLCCGPVCRARLNEGQCPACEYSLEGLRTQPDGCTICPECGAAWNFKEGCGEQLRTLADRLRRRTPLRPED